MLWDQELYEGFKYNHERTFFHTFELENCIAGFSFTDEKEANQFYKKVEQKEKYAKSKGTKAPQPMRSTGRNASGNHGANARENVPITRSVSILRPSLVTRCWFMGWTLTKLGIREWEVQ